MRGGLEEYSSVEWGERERGPNLLRTDDVLYTSHMSIFRLQKRQGGGGGGGGEEEEKKKADI
jgi:hypothetical protein